MKAIFCHGITYFLWIVLRVYTIAELLQNISQSACLCICEKRFILKKYVSKKKIYLIQGQYANQNKNSTSMPHADVTHNLYFLHFKIKLTIQGKDSLKNSQDFNTNKTALTLAFSLSSLIP